MIEPSIKTTRTFNPIRDIVDNLRPPQHHHLPPLNLALGDPTVYDSPALRCPAILTTAVIEALTNGNANGYLPSVGSGKAREAIALFSSRPGYIIDADDVIICSGCSGAIDLILQGMLNEGDNILIPQPAFPLYRVVANSLGGHVKSYALKPKEDWECDLESLEMQIDSHTKAIVINNPSNPCGNNFSRGHLEEIAAIARRHKLLVIADEIYGGCVFDGEFVPFHTCTKGDVPVITLSGLAKEFLVPGWRVGWFILHDSNPSTMEKLKIGLKKLTQLVLGANSLIQSAIPALLVPTTTENKMRMDHYNSSLKSFLAGNAEICLEELSNCPYLKVIKPCGALYVMVEILVDSIDFGRMNGSNDSVTENKDVLFANCLLQEQNLFILPGKCFDMPNFIRLVICPPPDVLRDALSRLKFFCEEHKK